MAGTTCGRNLGMQMRVAARDLRIVEVPLGCRLRRGSVWKVSGKPSATLPAAWTLAKTFMRLAVALRRGRA